MKAPTRIHKGKRQILFEGVWCDVPHGYRTGDEVNAKHKATMRAVASAKEVLGDVEDRPRWFDLKDLPGRDHDIWIDEWSRITTKKIDDAMIKALTSGLIGTMGGFKIHHSPAAPLDRKQNDE